MKLDTTLNFMYRRAASLLLGLASLVYATSCLSPSHKNPIQITDAYDIIRNCRANPKKEKKCLAKAGIEKAGVFYATIPPPQVAVNLSDLPEEVQSNLSFTCKDPNEKLLYGRVTITDLQESLGVFVIRGYRRCAAK